MEKPKNQVIYKGLKFENNQLKFRNEVIFDCGECVNFADIMQVNQSVFLLLKYLSVGDKKYIKECIDFSIETINNGAYKILHLICKDDNGDIYKRNMDFIAFDKFKICRNG
jgi:hypothetical protein